MPRPKDKIDRITTDDGTLSSQNILCECRTCKEHKPVSEFYKDPQSRNGLRSNCKQCQKKYNTSAEELARKRERNRRYRREDPRVRMYEAAKHRAKERGLPFSITIDDIHIPEKCPVFEIPMKVAEGYRNSESLSLDRVKPELGYVPSNIVVMCHRANSLKKDASIEELEAIVKYMKREEKGGNNG